MIMFTLDIYDSMCNLCEYMEELDDIMCEYSHYSDYPIGISFNSIYRDGYVVDYVMGVSEDYMDVVFTLNTRTQSYYITNGKMVELPSGE